MANADPFLPPILQWAYFYFEAGFSVIPTAEGEKRPGLKSWAEWEKERPSKNQLMLWLTGLYRSSGIGLVTGAISGNVFVIDADAGEGKEGPENLDDVQMMHDDLPMTWTARSGGGGKHLFFRAPEGMRILNGRNVLATHVDVRGEGGFLVLPPSLHPSGRMYEWIDGLDPATTAIADAPAWLLPLVEDREGRLGGATPGGSTSRSGGAGTFSDFGRRIDGREEYMRDLVWARFLEERRGWPGPLTDALLEQIAQECWEVFQRKCKARGVSLDADGRGISEMRRKVRYTAKKWDGKLASAAKEPKPNGKTWQESPKADPFEEESPKPPPSLDVVPAFPIDPMSIPTRPWLIPGLLIRNHVSVLVAPPGVGKSLLTLQVALACGANLPWGGWTPRQACRVLVINSEDDLDEMRRRLVASVQVMGISQESVADKVFLADNPETIVIAKTDPRSKAVMRTPLVDAIIDMATRLQIDLIVVDPFAETFEGDENSNSELKWAAALWREIARKTNSAVWLVHHTRKYAQDMTGDADAARGAGALVGVARIVATAFVMAKEAAEGFNIEEPDRHRYIRYDSAKANLSLVTGEAKWFEKVGQSIGNSKGLLAGDEVGVLKPWNTPGILDGVSGAAINQILQTISNGVLGDDGRPIGITWSGRRQAKKRWAGNVIMDTLQCDADKAAKIIKAWLASELLIEFDYDDAEQRPKKGLRVNFNKRPGAEA